MLTRNYAYHKKYDTKMYIGIALTTLGLIGLTSLWFRLKWSGDKFAFYGTVLYVLVTIGFGFYLLNSSEAFLTVPVPAEYTLEAMDNKECDLTLTHILEKYPQTASLWAEFEGGFEKYDIGLQGHVSRNGMPVLHDVNFRGIQKLTLEFRSGQTLVLCRR